MASEIIWFLVCLTAATYLYFVEMHEKSVVIWPLVVFLVATACKELAVFVGSDWVIFQAGMVRFYSIIRIHFRLLSWSR